MRRVVVFGVFDRLHPGHLFFLKRAKHHGDHLTVVITRDVRAKVEKGRAPTLNERDRLTILRAIRCVDNATLGDRVGKWKIVRTLRPDIVCIGYDQDAKWLSKSKLSRVPLIIRIPRLKNYHT